MITTKRIFVILILSVVLSYTIKGQGDVDGSEDHSLISRYPASLIKWYDVQEFDQYKIGRGPVTGYKHIDDWLTVEGKLTRIYYSLSGSRSVNEVYFNYLKALKKNGFDILADGLVKGRNVGKGIGGRNWLGVYFADNSVPPKVDLLTGSSTTGGSAFIAGKLNKNNATVYVAISLAQYSANKVYYIIDIIEEVAIEDNFIFINADIMKNEIEANGKIALYGIFFDHDKATIKPESDPTFKEVNSLLANNPKLNLYVVGHTDMTGIFSHNMKLSSDRANTVVKELITKYKIKSKRLTPQGVGPLAPVSTNVNEVGRKNNRRVELVSKLH